MTKKIHRFYTNDFVLDDKILNLNDAEILHQLSKVLRIKIGEEIVIFDSSGTEYLICITDIQKKYLQAKIENISKHTPDKKKVNLFQSIIKKDNFEWIVQKTTELGISSITPVISERTIKTAINNDRINKIAIEASEQSGRCFVPEISNIIDLKKSFMKDKNTLNIFLNFGGKTPSEIDTKKYTNINLYIGPEGGWTDSEVKLFQELGFTEVSLGQNVLRAETAAIVGCYEFVK